MTTFGDFLKELFKEGRIVLDGRPTSSESERTAAVAVLSEEFEKHQLDVAGEPIGFEPSTALMAAELLRQVSWYLVNRVESAEAMNRSLVMPRSPRTAAEHLSGDLTFRFLPPIQRRARSIAPEDRLASFLADLLRAWPLSGVLSDLAEGPREIGDLGGHPGLWMLYAERLAADEKPGWIPQGSGLEQVELVFQGLSRSLTSRPSREVSKGVVRG